MVKLDLEKLNSSSPYKVVGPDNDGAYFFSTDYGVDYKVFFIKDENIKSDEAYQFAIVKANDLPSPSDPKVKATVIEIILAFFERNNHVVLYICETGDGKQASRDRLFKTWFNSAAEKGTFLFVTANIKDEEGIDNFAAIISRLDNPNLESAVHEFKLLVKLFSEKPED